MKSNRQDRVLEIFFRALRGEAFSVSSLAAEYGVSEKTVARCINEIKLFLAEHGELTGFAELEYSRRDRCYHLNAQEFLSDKELFAVAEVLIGARAFSKAELEALTDKLKRFTSSSDRKKLDELIKKELFHYSGVKHDCESVEDRLYELTECIHEKKEILINREVKNYGIF